MAELTEADKLEIVTMLACFRDPKQIVDHFGEEYKIELGVRQVGAYDPTRAYYDAGEKWLAIFDAKRKAYLEEVASIPIANQGFRLNVLNDELKKAVREGKSTLAILEQAAKEVGGVLTNERNVRVDDSRRLRIAEMSPEDRRAEFARIVAEALATRDPPGAEAAGSTVQ